MYFQMKLSLNALKASEISLFTVMKNMLLRGHVTDVEEIPFIYFNIIMVRNVL